MRRILGGHFRCCRARMLSRTKICGSANFRGIISTFVIDGTVLSLRIASLIKCIPFELEKGKENRLLLTQANSNWKLPAWYFVTMLNVAYTAFQCTSFAVNMKLNGFTTDTAIQTSLLMRSLLAVLPLVNNLGICFSRQYFFVQWQLSLCPGSNN